MKRKGMFTSGLTSLAEWIGRLRSRQNSYPDESALDLLLRLSDWAEANPEEARFDEETNRQILFGWMESYHVMSDAQRCRVAFALQIGTVVSSPDAVQEARSVPAPPVTPGGPNTKAIVARRNRPRP